MSLIRRLATVRADAYNQLLEYIERSVATKTLVKSLRRFCKYGLYHKVSMDIWVDILSFLVNTMQGELLKLRYVSIILSLPHKLTGCFTTNCKK